MNFGKVHWHQQDLARISAKDRRALGIGRTFQVAQVFEALSVYQNLQLVLQAAKGVSAFDVLDQCQNEAASFWLEAMGLQNLGKAALNDSAAHLSYGNQKRLELAMAMAGGYGKDIADTVQVQMNSFSEAHTAWQHWQNQRL